MVSAAGSWPRDDSRLTRFEHLQPDHLQPNHSIWTIALKGGEPTLRPPPLLVAALFLAAGDLL